MCKEYQWGNKKSIVLYWEDNVISYCLTIKTQKEFKGSFTTPYEVKDKRLPNFYIVNFQKDFIYVINTSPCDEHYVTQSYKVQ